MNTMLKTMTICAALLAAPALAMTDGNPDGWITSKSKVSLWTTAGIPSTAVHVDTSDGVVTLHGKVGTVGQKALAEATVRGVTGVRGVTNLLQVVPEGDVIKVDRSDAQVKEQVEKTLKADPVLKDSRIGVKSVDKGLVLLSGQAATFSDHVYAVGLVDRVAGVRGVSTEVMSPDKFGPSETMLFMGPFATSPPKSGLTDSRITAAVKLRLLTTSYVPSTEVSVDTDGNVVTLFGMVPTQAAKLGAEEAAAKVSGVLRVDNLIEVVPRANQKVVEAKDSAILTELKTQLSGRNDFREVGYDVKNGVVHLTGSVDTGWDKLSVIRLARKCSGVRGVEEQLAIKAEHPADQPMVF